jgi:phosphatidylglycerophosphate synthase
MTFNEIYNIAVPEAKRKEEKFNIWVTIAVRPLSVLLTKPFIKTKVKPTQITAASILCSLAGFILFSCANTTLLRIFGWLLFFAWAVLDGVDGNLARCTNQCSQLGDLWDTTGGYAAMVLMYFSAGIVAYFDKNTISFCEPYLMIIIGSATAIFSIFPRLVMHKKKSYGTSSDAVKSLSDKRSFGLTQIVAMNLISPSGFMQVILLICILCHLMSLFVTIYAIVNFGIMTISLYKLLKA